MATLSFRVTEEVYGMLLHAGRVRAPDGPGWIDAGLIRAVALGFLGSHLPLWWEHVAATERIAVRDRFRCQVPGCSSRCGSAHHIRYRSRGGSDDDWNLVFVCPTQHLEGIHRGHLRVGGRAPADLTFERGVRADGTVLQRFRGQRRVA